jgi:hypothetical protein
MNKLQTTTLPPKSHATLNTPSVPWRRFLACNRKFVNHRLKIRVWSFVRFW